MVGLCVLAVLTFIGSLGKAFEPYTPGVPRAVLVISGAAGALLSVALLLSGVMELIDRARRGDISHVSQDEPISRWRTLNQSRASTRCIGPAEP